MSVFSDASMDIMALYGRTVILTPAGGEAQEVSSIVSDHGFRASPPTADWDTGLFQGQGRYAAFRFRPNSLAAEPEPGDMVTFEGRDYEVRQILHEPTHLVEPMWWTALGVAEQRGGW